jgi:hypothetical protein
LKFFSDFLFFSAKSKQILSTTKMSYHGRIKETVFLAVTRCYPIHDLTFTTNPKLLVLHSQKCPANNLVVVSVVAIWPVESAETLWAAVGVGGGKAGVSSDAGEGSVTVGEGSVEEGGISLSLGLTLVDLANGGDGEGGGDGLVGSGTGSIDVGSIGVSVGGISVGRVQERWVSLSLSLTLSKNVSVVSVSVGVSVIAVAVGSIAVASIASIAIGVGSSSVSGVEEGWVGLGLGLSIDSCSADGKSYDLKWRNKKARLIFGAS